METSSDSLGLHELNIQKHQPSQEIPTPQSDDNTTAQAPAPSDAEDPPITAFRPWRFWAILSALSFTGMMSALEGTIITSALPTIAEALGGGDNVIWVPNAYLLAQVAVFPLVAQASNVFGRRNLLLGSVLLFTLGSGLSGGASSMAMLIAARTVQGLGGGGILLLIETVTADIVPLRERGKYTGIVMIGATVGATLGPFFGGLITEHSTWRWCFYINVPVGIATFAALFVFLRLRRDRSMTFAQSLKRIDFSGNAIFVGAIAAVLISVTWGGTIYSWGAYQILVPLILGIFGVFLFTAFEWTPKLCPEPSFPRKIVSNRTSATALMVTFIHAIVTYWMFYFLPIYFQGVKGLSPTQSGIDTLPTFAGNLIFAGIGGGLMSKLGRYKPIQLVSFAAMTLGFGLFSLLDANSSDAAWVCFQLIAAIGAGGIAATLLPAIQAPLDESYVATATGVFSFARYFGCIWGVTIPSVVFNNECRRLAATITNKSVAAILTGGRAYEHATAAFLDSIEDPVARAEVVGLFTQALKTSWLVGIAFAGLGFLLPFVEREVELRTQINNEYGMEDKKTLKPAESATAGL